MKYSFVFALLFVFPLLLVFSLAGCSGDRGATPTSIDESSNKGRVLTPPEQAAIDYFNKMRERDLEYCYFYSLHHHRALEEKMKKRGLAHLSGKERQRKKEEIFNNEVAGVLDPVKNLWSDWPESLDGTKITVLESDVMSDAEITERGIVPVGNIVYAVFLQFNWTKISSSVQSGGRLIKQFVVLVPVHFDGRDYFIDSLNWKYVPLNKEFWGNKNSF